MGSALFHTFALEMEYGWLWGRKEKFDQFRAVTNRWALIAVMEGAFDYEIAGQRGTAVFGDIVICPPGVPFQRVVIEPLTFHHIRFDLRGAEQPRNPDTDPFPVGKISIADTKRLSDNYARMSKLFIAKPAVQSREYNHLLNDIWYLYCEEIEQATQASEAGVKDLLALRTRQFIRKNAFQSIRLKTLSDSLGISQAQLSQRFTAAYNLSPIQYATSLRLEKARKLLLETALNLDEIAESCGYRSGYYLNRVFSREMGIAPGRFRKLNHV
jgi:AraC-like DNA-binding protein